MRLPVLLDAVNKSCSVYGLCASSKGWFFGKWHKRWGRSLLVVVKGPHEAEEWIDDIKAFSSASSAVFPCREEGRGPAALEAAGERWNILEAPPDIIVSNVSAFEDKVISPDDICNIRFSICPGMKLPIHILLKRLADTGYERTDCVEYKGEFAGRGGIVDVFPPNTSYPLRIEFAGDKIDSMRSFHPQTQRSLKREDRPVHIYPAEEDAVYKKRKLVSLAEFMPANTVIVDDGCGIRAKGQVIRLDYTGAFPECIKVNIKPLEYMYGFRMHTGTPWEYAFRDISGWIGGGYRVSVWCNNTGEKERLNEFLEEKNLFLPEINIGRITGGFVYPEEKLAVISDREIFSRYKVRTPRKKFRAYTAPVKEFSELIPGGYVVHIDHGIGKYLGLHKEKGREMITIQYADKARLYVPLADAYLVERYIGIGGRRPKLSRLGGKRWGAVKRKTEKALLDTAGELLAVQAKRDALKGISFSQDTPWQEQMEDSFIYEETEDQRNAVLSVKKDMESTRPMDRLICGDVGYGKTEVAVRAAFKAVLEGKQAAVLVPTTILAQQHYRTFSDRLADFPVKVECLSRFRTEKEQRDIIKWIREGRVDIVIGTHRMIQKDVVFRDLGLVIIDEEQRFGVRHKEWLKKMCELVDVITMTATPIPRTLYMSLMGIKDMSIINTPPRDRLAVQTVTAHYSPELIRKIILKEIQREGQVYYLHNRVNTIEGVRKKLEGLVPEARFLTAHGQMEEDVLAQVMDRFVRGEADVLVCTTIIQSGLDIPNVNTIVIESADTFGLADLYQLRGRVGRCKYQAYAYLLLSPGGAPASGAAKRLKAIQDFSHLGAGFKIAMRDMEIRGAGNILGRQQHGHIQAVGFDIYCRLLKRNILKLQGKQAEEPYEVIMNIGISGSIPEWYIESGRIRIDFYKRIAGILDIEELRDIEKEIIDRFGPIPEDVRVLLNVTAVRVCAVKKRIKEIRVWGNRVSVKRLNGAQDVTIIRGDRLDWLIKNICGTIGNKGEVSL